MTCLAFAFLQIQQKLFPAQAATVAAELAAFGMQGVGAIFAAYRDGALEDDDEVAVVHVRADHAALITPFLHTLDSDPRRKDSVVVN